MLIQKDLQIREVNLKEYTNFTQQIKDKSQLGCADMVAVLQEGQLLIVKNKSGESLTKVREQYLAKEDIVELDIEEFNSGIKFVEDRLVINRGFYEFKNFIITGLKV